MLKIYCYRVVFIASRISHALTTSIANLTVRAIVVTVTIAFPTTVRHVRLVTDLCQGAVLAACRNTASTCTSTLGRTWWRCFWIACRDCSTVTLTGIATRRVALLGAVYGLSTLGEPAGLVLATRIAAFHLDATAIAVHKGRVTGFTVVAIGGASSIFLARFAVMTGTASFIAPTRARPSLRTASGALKIAKISAERAFVASVLTAAPTSVLPVGG